MPPKDIEITTSVHEKLSVAKPWAAHTPPDMSALPPSVTTVL
jgi:hypothetical protein